MEEESWSEGESSKSGYDLLNSLLDSCVKIPNSLTSVQNLTPQTLFSISSQSLHLLNNNNNTNQTPPFSPLSIAERFKMCSQLASDVSALGFNVTFHKFLYPSEEDYNKLIRFFVTKLSELPPQQPQKNPSDERANSDHGSSDRQVDETATTLRDVKTDFAIQHSTKLRSQYSSDQEGWEGTLKEVEKETEDVLSKLKKREEELCILLATLENQPKKGPSRRSYIQRITEITNNSRKQDADIEHILKDTRELQLESNFIHERLDRTYAVVDEALSREGKKDPVGRQAYTLLTAIHESFEQISNNILATDRVRREAVEYEAKLSALSRRSFDVDKLKADLDAIRRENNFLEQHGVNDDNSKNFVI